MARFHAHVKLSGDHNECPSCGKLFNSTRAFEKHRYGEWGNEHYTHAKRRCLSESEMLEKGMAISSTGWWISSVKQMN